MLFTEFFFSLLMRLQRDEEGQTAIEYGLVLALIAVGIAIAMKAGLLSVVTTVTGKVTTAVTGAS